MVVSAGPVRMAVLDLFGGRGANRLDLDLEVQDDAGERRVGIQRDVVVCDLVDQDVVGLAFRARRLELHSDLKVVDAAERAAFAAQANEDLERFLCMRAAELVPGGKVLVEVFGESTWRSECGSDG